MYMYHFVNTTGWGECYTVMSNNKIEARTALKNFLDEINSTYNITFIIREENDDTFDIKMVSMNGTWDTHHTYQIYKYDINDVLITERN